MNHRVFSDLNFYTKDEKYIPFYKPNDIYWGLGIENENYLTQNNFNIRTGAYIHQNMKKERYSVDYSSNYDNKQLEHYLRKNFNTGDIFSIPRYINCHTLAKTDINGQHSTLYSTNNIPNPKFLGESIHEILLDRSIILKEGYNNWYVYDGDTIEIITQNFYKSDIYSCVTELMEKKNTFITELKSSLDLFSKDNNFDLSFMKLNYGLVQFETNPNNVAIFNNGTYHINITIPTQLDDEARILDEDLFLQQHKIAMRTIQWLEPIIIGLYGCPDPFGFNSKHKYVNGSLRLTASRYIGVGTYNTETMKTGKQLNDAIKMPRNSWYQNIYDKTYYHPCNLIGYDFNFAKHYQAGIELRFLDFFPEEALSGLITFLILLIDHSLNLAPDLLIADNDRAWHDFAEEALIHGYTVKVYEEYRRVLQDKLQLPFIDDDDLPSYMKKLTDWLFEKYNGAFCSRVMNPQKIKPQLYNINQYMYECNYVQYIPINNPNCVRITSLYGDDIRSKNILLHAKLNSDLPIEELHNKLIHTTLALTDYMI